MDNNVVISNWDYVIGGYRPWEICKLNSGRYAIITNVEYDSLRRCKVTFQYLYLSRFKIINRIQRRFLSKILKPNLLQSQSK